MVERTWSKNSQPDPPVAWDGRTKSFSIVLSGLKAEWSENSVKAEWTPPLTYVVRIRKANEDDWSVGFETPLTGCGFVGLIPDTEYDVEVRAKDSNGESDPVRIKVRTGRDGALGV